jgi:hypothetical protein
VFEGLRDEIQNLKKLPDIFLRWNIPIGRRQNVKPRWRAMGFSPKKILYMPLNMHFLDGGSAIAKKKNFNLNCFLNQEFPEKFHL